MDDELRVLKVDWVPILEYIRKHARPEVLERLGNTDESLIDLLMHDEDEMLELLRARLPASEIEPARLLLLTAYG